MQYLNTKHKGDVAEQAAILAALKRGWSVSVPIGDRDSYDLVFDIAGRLLKIQVKAAWKDERSNTHYCGTRMMKTNRKVYKSAFYNANDFDFALIYVDDFGVFYVVPVSEFVKYRGDMTLAERDTIHKKPRSAKFREAWDLLETENPLVLVREAG